LPLPPPSPHILGQQRLAGAAAQASHSSVPGAIGSGFAQQGAAGNWSAAPTLPAISAQDAATVRAAAASGHSHHGIFSQRVDGTKGITLVLLIDSILLGVLVMWRAARRWVAPRLA
jgi:hypothetical protein